MSRETKPGKIGAWIAPAPSIGLVVRVIAIDNPEALVIVAPALVGALLAVALVAEAKALLTALVDIGVTATFSLIGWIGLRGSYLRTWVLRRMAPSRRGLVLWMHSHTRRAQANPRS